MNIIKRLQELKVFQDSLEGTNQRKRWYKTLGLVSGIISILLSLTSIALLSIWISDSWTSPVTYLMRVTSTLSIIIWTCQLLCLLITGHLLDMENTNHFSQVNGLIVWSYLEGVVAVFFTMIVYPHQAMVSHDRDQSSFVQTSYFYVIPSLFSVTFFLRITFFVLSAMFDEGHANAVLESENKMEKFVEENPTEVKVDTFTSTSTEPLDEDDPFNVWEKDSLDDPLPEVSVESTRTIILINPEIDSPSTQVSIPKTDEGPVSKPSKGCSSMFDHFKSVLGIQSTPENIEKKESFPSDLFHESTEDKDKPKTQSLEEGTHHDLPEDQVDPHEQDHANDDKTTTVDLEVHNF